MNKVATNRESVAVNKSAKKGFARQGEVLLAFCALLLGMLPASAQTNIIVDPAKAWVGYVNIYDLNGGYQFGSSWGTADLCAIFSGSVLTLSPNKIADTSSYWYIPSGGPGAVGNKIVDANMYVQDDTLGGQTVTFSGYVWSNTLVPTNNNCTAFIKEFNSSYAVVGSATSNLSVALPADGFFSITLPTSGNAGNHVQYGFETIGPCWWSTDQPSKGTVVISTNAIPSGPVITGFTPVSPAYVNVTSNISLTVSATGTSLAYQWLECGVNLADGPGVSGETTATLTLSNVTANAEAGYSVVVTDNLSRKATNSAFVVVFTPDNLSFDPNATLGGYINAFQLDQITYAAGFSYPAAQLRASLTNGVVTLQPNTDLYYGDSNIYAWTNLDGTPNAWLEQDYYIQNDDLAGHTLTFSGYCPSNTLGGTYLAQAFIKELTPTYAPPTVQTILTNLEAGKVFSISASTTAGNHVQYGFVLFGTNNPPIDPLTQGYAQATIISPSLAATRTGFGSTLSFATMTGHNYIVQYKNSLTDASWTSLSPVSGNGSTVEVPDSTTEAGRFYRLLIQ